MAINKYQKAYVPLLLDVNIGLFAFLVHHFKLFNLKV
jgi:hypothetical protein